MHPIKLILTLFFLICTFRFVACGPVLPMEPSIESGQEPPPIEITTNTGTDNPEPTDPSDSSEPMDRFEVLRETVQETAKDTEQDAGVEPLPEQVEKKSWVVALGDGADSILGTKIAVSQQGSLYITGRFQGKVRLGSQILQASKDLDGFVSKLSSKGEVEWTIHFAGDGIQDIRGIQARPQGGLSITGTFSKSMTVRGKTYQVSDGGCFVMQVDAQGQQQWFVQAGGQGADVGDALTHDPQGNVYVFGTFNGQGRFGSITLTHKHLYDFFVTKIDPQGTFQWVTTTTGSATSTAAGIAITSKKSLVIVGQYLSDMQLDGIQLQSQQTDMVVAELDTQGKFQWAITTKGSGVVVPHQIRVDNQDNLYITGEVEGEKIFGSFALKQPQHGDVFLAKLSPQGKFTWVNKNKGTNVHIHPYGLVLDGKNQPVVAGEYTGKPSFGTKSFPTTTQFQAFLAGASTGGSFAWTLATTNAKAVHARDLAHGPLGGLFLVGEFHTSAVFGTEKVSPGDSQTYLFVWKHLVSQK